MLPVLLLLLSVAAPLVQATRLFSVDDAVSFNDHSVLDLARLGARMDPTVPDVPGDDANQLIGFPDGRGSGNQFVFEDFSQCDAGPGGQQPIPLTPPYNDFTFVPVTSGVIFSCWDGTSSAFGRSPSSKALSFDVGASLATTVAHAITTKVSMFANGYEAAIDFMMYIPSSVPSTGGILDPADVSVEYTIEGEPMVTLDPAGGYESGSDLILLQLGPETGDGQWKRYILYFAVGEDVPNPVDAQDVTITVKFKRAVAAHPIMLVDEVYVRYYTLIRNPRGDDLFFQEFDSCSATAGTPPAQPTVKAALNSVESSNLWDLNSPEIQCNNVHYTSDDWSLLMASRVQIGSRATLDRSITRFIDRALEPGQEVTLEFWVRYDLSTNPGGQVRAPVLRVGVEVDTGAVGWRDTAFSGELLPGPRVIEDEVSSAYEQNDFYKYRVTYTLPSTQYAAPQFIRLQISINHENANNQQITSGIFHLDDIRMKYTSFSTNSNPPGTVGDPQFVGLYNQNYQVHGIDGGVYNLVSSPTTQVNSRFVFLSEGQCPIFDGIPARNCFAHPGSYLGSIGIQEIVDGVNHKVTIVSGPANTGFASVEIDGMKLSVNDSVAHGTTFDVNFVSSHIVMVNTADFAFTFENSDMFINQGVAAHRRLSELTSHGLFGQTHKRVVYPSKLKYIEGDVDDYLIAEDDLFGHDFVYNQFHS